MPFEKHNQQSIQDRGFFPIAKKESAKSQDLVKIGSRVTFKKIRAMLERYKKQLDSDHEQVVFSTILKIQKIQELFEVKENENRRDMLQQIKIISQLKKSKLVNAKKSRDFNESLFIKLKEDKSRILNPIHVCKSKSLMKYSKISDKQMLEHWVFRLSKSNLDDLSKLSQILCIGFNQQRSYLIVGANERNQIIGQIFSEDQKEEITIKIKNITKYNLLKAKVQDVRIKFIPIFQYNQNLELKFESGNYLLLIEINRKNERFLIAKKEQNVNNQFYKMAHKFFEKKQRKHVHNSCEEPQIGNILVNQKQKKTQLLKNFRHSLIYIASAQKDLLMETFAEKLRQKNIRVQVSKPFPLEEKMKFEQFWILNHEQPNKVLQSLMKKIDKTRCMQLFPIHKNIVFKNAVSQDIIDKFYRSFSSLPEGSLFKAQKKKFNRKPKYWLKFEQPLQALYGWLYFNTQNIKSRFSIKF